jgi:heterodisulfide reductase subunit A
LRIRDSKRILSNKAILWAPASGSLPTLEGFDPAGYISRLIEQVKGHPKISIHLGCEIEKIDGHVGGFVSIIKNQTGETVSLRHGTAIMATGAEPYRPEEYHYGQHPGVLIQSELEKAIKQDREKIGSLNRSS